VTELEKVTEIKKKNANALNIILVSKAARVFVFGIVSIMTPVYVATLGYSPFYVGLVLAVIIAGNIASNITITRYGKQFGDQRALSLFSILMLVSGVILSSTTLFPLILFACFLGNISTTGTEAGPFQSIETAILPNFALQKTDRAFGLYNLIGYASSAVGALAAALPSLFGNTVASFHYLYLIYGFVGLVLFLLYRNLRMETKRKPDKMEAEVIHSEKRSDDEKAAQRMSRMRQDISRLSILFGIDAFGGGFVSQSLLSYWFFLVYGVSLGGLGIIFFIVNVITAISIFAAPFIAERIGNLRTMVLTHLVSDVFLIAIPLAGSLIPALTFLFLRQSVSQMDVPTRQTFMVEIFQSEDRVSANAITNTSRSVGSIFGGPISGALLSAGLISIPILSAGFSKIFYDIGIYLSYRKRAN
jgi:MFS family permease